MMEIIKMVPLHFQGHIRNMMYKQINKAVCGIILPRYG